MESFINQKNVNVVFFTNNKFGDLNKKIRDYSVMLGEEHFLFINTDNEIELVKNLNINSVPLFHIYKDGKLIEEIFGTYKNICDIIRLHF